MRLQRQRGPYVSLFFRWSQMQVQIAGDGQIGFLQNGPCNGRMIPIDSSTGKGRKLRRHATADAIPERRPAALAPRTSPTPPPQQLRRAAGPVPPLHRSKELPAGRLRSHVGRQRGARRPDDAALALLVDAVPRRHAQIQDIVVVGHLAQQQRHGVGEVRISLDTVF